MKMLCGTLIGVVALLMVAHLALAGPPSWDTQINNPQRFMVLSDFNNQAVLDLETGLVWEQSPEPRTRPEGLPQPPPTWLVAQASCNIRTVGGRKGWRLPTIQELASLIDPTIAIPGPALPLGHPFSNVQTHFYWSATTLGGNTNLAWGVWFQTGDVGNYVKSYAKNHHWCVRGGQGVNPQ